MTQKSSAQTIQEHRYYPFVLHAYESALLARDIHQSIRVFPQQVRRSRRLGLEALPLYRPGHRVLDLVWKDGMRVVMANNRKLTQSARSFAHRYNRVAKHYGITVKLKGHRPKDLPLRTFLFELLYLCQTYDDGGLSLVQLHKLAVLLELNDATAEDYHESTRRSDFKKRVDEVLAHRYDPQCPESAPDEAAGLKATVTEMLGFRRGVPRHQAPTPTELAQFVHRTQIERMRSEPIDWVWGAA